MIRNRRNWLIGGAVLLAILLFFLFRGERHHDSSRAEPVAVRADVITVAASPVSLSIAAEGTVRPSLEATLAPKILSTVSAVLVREGDRVRAGQTLVRLEARDLAASVRQAEAAASAATSSAKSAMTAARMQERATAAEVSQAEAAVKQAGADLQAVRSGARRQERAQAVLAVQQAAARYDLARTEAERMRRLYGQDVVTKQRLDQAEAAEKVALADLNSARQQQDLVEEGSRNEDIIGAEERLRAAEAGLAAAKAARLSAQMRREQAKAAEAQAGQASAALGAARTTAGYASIKAPFAGIVTRRLVDPGDQVGPGTAVLTIEDRGRWRLEADVPESEPLRMEPGQSAEVRIDGLSGGTIDATVVEVRPAGDPATRTVHVKAALEHDPRLRSGMFGRLMLGRGAAEQVLVPKTAVLDLKGLPRVWAVSRKGRAELRLVTLGEERDAQVVVLSGLSAGDRIAVTNLDALVNGAKVLDAAGPSL